MLDLCNALAVLKKEEMPIYVARDLMRLPPVDISHIDVTILLSELALMRKQMENMTNQTKTVVQIQQELADLKDFVQRQRDDSTTQLKRIIEEQEQRDFPNLNQTMEDAVIHIPEPRQESYSAVAAKPITVKQKTTITAAVIKKPVPIIGTRTTNKLVINNKKFKKVFVSRLGPHTTEEDMQSYLKDELEVDSKCTKLKTRFDTYSSFKIEAQCCEGIDLLDPGMWPAGLLVKQFFEKRIPGEWPRAD